MKGSLQVIIDRSLPLAELLELAAVQVMKMLQIERELRIDIQIPPGALFAETPSMVPDHPEWGLYLYLDDVDESLVDAYLSTLSTESGAESPVLCFEELRTPASKVLAAGLAIAAAQLLRTEVLDYEHVWADRERVPATELLQQLTVSSLKPSIESALVEFSGRMNRHF
jgi:hypothetical protein